jgi:hypothetical protein
MTRLSVVIALAIARSARAGSIDKGAVIRMKTLSGIILVAFAVASASCAGDARTPIDTTGAAVAIDGGANDAAGAGDAAGVLPISAALNCRSTAGVGGPPAGTALQYQQLDTARFPDALCNDGTAAVIYFRPALGTTDPGNWLIELQGGGTCTSGQDCADRWCGVGTNFNALLMSNRGLPRPGMAGLGILAQRADNPFRTWNQVYVHYCSSDTHDGTRRDVVVDAVDPALGTPVRYRVNFLGSRIIDAVLATLRQDGVPALTYSVGVDVPVAMPDLDMATHVVVAGASAGGSGTVVNVDRIAGVLRANNARCAGGPPCPVDVRALVDSMLAPAYESYDYTASTMCLGAGLCTYDQIFTHEWNSGASVLWGRVGDASCRAWHATNMPGTEWRCADEQHLIRHHVTTPMFIRSSQYDQLKVGNAIDAGLQMLGAGHTLMPDEYAQMTRDQAGALANIQVTAEEGALIATVPGVFSPTCVKHDTLNSDPQIYDVRINVGGLPFTMFRTWNNWIAGAAPASVITAFGGANFCP